MVVMRNLIRRWQIVPIVVLAACTSLTKKRQISEAAVELAGDQEPVVSRLGQVALRRRLQSRQFPL